MDSQDIKKITKIIPKNYAQCFLYTKNNNIYEKKITGYLMTADEIDKADPAFEDIRYDVKKRQITSFLSKVLDSKNIVLLHPNMPMPKAFKVLGCNDIKAGGKFKVFIDTSDLFRMDNGKWVCKNIDIFIAYLMSAMNTLIYYADPKRLLMKDGIISGGAEAFAKLFTYIIDYLFKVSAVSSIRDKCMYLSAMYYLVNILGKEMNDTTKRYCKKIAKISDKEEEILLLSIDEDKCFINIKFFIEELNKVLKLSKLTLDVFLEKWLWLYGVGTQFALELYPAFATMITNAYVGCYINNQKTIEKIVGSDLIEITTTIIKVGGESV